MPSARPSRPSAVARWERWCWRATSPARFPPAPTCVAWCVPSRGLPGLGLRRRRPDRRKPRDPRHRSGGTVTARVLAGTVARGGDADRRRRGIRGSHAEHEGPGRAPVRRAECAQGPRPHTSALAAADEPFTLKLPNVWHLATDVEGELSEDASSLDLLSVLHPTAAVAGTPTAVAMDVIRRLEPFDRGRSYAGAVGWTAASGDGEWAIALRCAQIDRAAPSSPRRDHGLRRGGHRRRQRAGIGAARNAREVPPDRRGTRLTHEFASRSFSTSTS